MIIERHKNYNEDHCWQYDIRLKNLNEDLSVSKINNHQQLKVSDFKFYNVTDKKEQANLKIFIERHEWLGTLSQYTTHWFACYYNDILAGVLLFNMPNSFSKLLGDDTKNLERLISRGACISWSPKNLASSFLMWSIDWMVRNTKFRIFTAYSDPSAMELGTIYQACNFYYLGNKFGSKFKYVNPYTGKHVSDRFFRQKTAYKKYASELGIEWQQDWSHKTGMNWHNMPDDIELELRKYSKQKQLNSEKIEIKLKHKYAYVKGALKSETKKLKKIYDERNKNFTYPKHRGV